MPNDLTTKSRASLRIILACYAAHCPEAKTAIYAKLKDEGWTPSPEDCPARWEDVQQWYNGLQRTGQIAMDSY